MSKQTTFYINEWEIFYVFRQMAGHPMYFIRGNVYNNPGLTGPSFYEYCGWSDRGIGSDGVMVAFGGGKFVLLKPDPAFEQRMSNVDFKDWSQVQKLFSMDSDIRVHPHMLGLHTTEEPSSLLRDALRLLQEEKTGHPLAENDVEFLRSVRSGRDFGEFSYKHGVWFYKQKMVYNEK